MDGQTCTPPKGRCADLAYRLAVYEAGHALSARALGFTILRVKMLPRPPTLESEKLLHGSGMNSLITVLRDRAIELFGGQIAESVACSTANCCSGDVSRIDELTRLIAGLEGRTSNEDVWFELEDIALGIFDRPEIVAAIVPVADLLHDRVQAGQTIIPGEDVEALLDELLGPRDRPGRMAALLNRITGRG